MTSGTFRIEMACLTSPHRLIVGRDIKNRGKMVKQCIGTIVAAAMLCLALSLVGTATARAQHGDWLLGTDGLLSGQQTPEGIFYQNLFSWYHASGDGFFQSGNLKCGPVVGRVCLSANLSANGSLD